jgi:hypothetical protein
MSAKATHQRALGLAIVCTLSLFSVSCDSPPATPEPVTKPAVSAPVPGPDGKAKIPAGIQSPGVLKTNK